MKACEGADVQIHVFLTSALTGGQRTTSRPGHFTSGKETPVPTGEKHGWAPEPVWTLWRKIIPFTGLELRSLIRPARSQSLYQLRYSERVPVKNCVQKELCNY
jgi:hypothetical protein